MNIVSVNFELMIRLISVGIVLHLAPVFDPYTYPIA